MEHWLLESLLTDEFADSIGPVLPPRAFRAVLARSRTVDNIRKSVRHGEITPDDIKCFVSAQTDQFRKGEQLPGDLAIAAIGVAIEGLLTEFADEYLHDLARLSLAEMPISIRVARESLISRRDLPKLEKRTAEYSKLPRVKKQTLKFQVRPAARREHRQFKTQKFPIK